jgi:hypothetical protein
LAANVRQRHGYRQPVEVFNIILLPIFVYVLAMTLRKLSTAAIHTSAISDINMAYSTSACPSSSKMNSLIKAHLPSFKWRLFVMRIMSLERRPVVFFRPSLAISPGQSGLRLP